jgi:predicted nucleotidyltransferase
LTNKFTKQKPSESRHKVAREAATLLYYGFEKEFFQAKTKAAENLGSRILPSNLEVALELDSLAEETEGPARTNRLIEMRKEALQTMKILRDHNPLLVGSVWRGTIKPTSDIDIEVYCNEPKRVADLLRAKKIKIEKVETLKVTEKGKGSASSHIFTETTSKLTAEITVRSLMERGKKRTCDTFGDEIKGLTIKELEILLKQNPSQKFLPR